VTTKRDGSNMARRWGTGSPCSVQACPNTDYARGLCVGHYTRDLNGNLDPERPLTRSMRRKCEAEGCDEPHAGRGLCKAHYRQTFIRPVHPCMVEGCAKKSRSATYPCSMHETRMRKHGTFDAPPLAQAPLGERFWRYVEKGLDDECWPWTGSTTNKRDGRSASDRDEAPLYAHRVSYEINVGPIPDGLVVMHSCDNPPCVNPAHLSAATQIENMRDMAAKGRAGRKRIA
jgi:hypothetical protein